MRRFVLFTACCVYLAFVSEVDAEEKREPFQTGKDPFSGGVNPFKTKKERQKPDPDRYFKVKDNASESKFDRITEIEKEINEVYERIEKLEGQLSSVQAEIKELSGKRDSSENAEEGESDGKE